MVVVGRGLGTGGELYGGLRKEGGGMEDLMIAGYSFGYKMSRNFFLNWIGWEGVDCLSHDKYLNETYIKTFRREICGGYEMYSSISHITYYLFPRRVPLLHHCWSVLFN